MEPARTYTQAELDAAVVAERDRLAGLVQERIAETVTAFEATPADKLVALQANLKLLKALLKAVGKGK